MTELPLRKRNECGTTICTKENVDENDTMVRASDKTLVEGDQGPKYFKGDKIYAKDNGEVYLATIKCSAFRSSVENSFWEYHVHFLGWSARHDKWLLEDLIRPDTDEEMRRLADDSKQKSFEQYREKKEKKAQLEKCKKERKNLTVKEDRFGGTASLGKKRKQNGHEPCNMVVTMEKYCSLPFTLQIILIEDRRKVTRKGRHVTQGYDPVLCEDWTPPRFVHNIPVTISVKDILKVFVKEKLKRVKKGSTVIENKEKGMDEYEKLSIDMASLFDIMLPKYLLFKEERAQYLSLIKQQRKQPNVPGIYHTTDSRVLPYRMSELYGGEFLLRMLVRLPLVFSSFESVSAELLSSELNNSSERTHPLLEQWNTLYQKHNHSLGTYITELIVYLQSNVKTLFRGIYREPRKEEWTHNERVFAKSCIKQTNDGETLAENHVKPTV